jgi:hypothetical protein
MAMPREVALVLQAQENEIDKQLQLTDFQAQKIILANRDNDKIDKLLKTLLVAFGAGLIITIFKKNIELNKVVGKLDLSASNKYLKALKDATLFAKIRKQTEDYIAKFPKMLNVRRIGGTTLDYKIKNVIDGATKTVRNIVFVGVQEGKSAQQIAKDISAFIRPTEQKAKKSPLVWFRERFKTIQKAKDLPQGSVGYNALRIARTESHITYRNGIIEMNREKDFVYGYKWNLSASHPAPDICDVWAEANNGMGPGVYDEGNLPIDHPNGLCFVTTAIYPISEYKKYLDGGKLKKYNFDGKTITAEEWAKTKKGNSVQDTINKLL